MKSKVTKRKVVFSTSLLCIIILVASIINFASSSTLTFSSGVYPQAAYTVWTDNNLFYLKDIYGVQPTISGSTDAALIINYALTNGDSIKILEGTYNLTTSLIPKAYNILEGSGWATILRMGNNASTNIIRFSGSDCSNFVLRNIALDGNKAEQTALTWRDQNAGIYSGQMNASQTGTALNNIVIDNVYITGILQGAAIRIPMSRNVRIQDCTIEYCGNKTGVTTQTWSDAILIGNSTNIHISNLIVRNVTDIGIALCNTAEGYITNPNIINSWGGINIGNEYNSTEYNSVQSNYNMVIGGLISNCTTAGSYLFQSTIGTGAERSDHITFQGTDFVNNQPNIKIESTWVTIQGCNFGMKNPLTDKEHISIINLPSGIIISGNMFVDADYGINVTAPIGNMILVGNIFVAIATSPLINPGSISTLNATGNIGYP